MSSHPRLHSYDLARFDFPSAVAALLGVKALDQLHVGTDLPLLTRGTDQSTSFHKAFYQSFAKIKMLYEQFIAEFVSQFFAESFCFQKVPTFRTQLPGNVAVGEFHTDRDYNHPDGEVNFWLPLTPAWGTNSIWIEKNIGSSDCQPFTVFPGQVLVFDAVNFRHGNVRNDTGATRVSFDFRCIPLSKYQPTNARTVNTKMRLIVGEYFELYQRVDHRSEASG